jgi:hypothetical protein
MDERGRERADSFGSHSPEGKKTRLVSPAGSPLRSSPGASSSGSPRSPLSRFLSRGSLFARIRSLQGGSGMGNGSSMFGSMEAYTDPMNAIISALSDVHDQLSATDNDDVARIKHEIFSLLIVLQDPKNFSTEQQSLKIEQIKYLVGSRGDYPLVEAPTASHGVPPQPLSTLISTLELESPMIHLLQQLNQQLLQVIALKSAHVEPPPSYSSGHR